MRTLSVLLFLGAVMHAQADTFVYVSMAPEEKIQVFRLDPADGKRSLREAMAPPAG